MKPLGNGLNTVYESFLAASFPIGYPECCASLLCAPQVPQSPGKLVELKVCIDITGRKVGMLQQEARYIC